MQASISTRFDSDVLFRLDELAVHQERSRSDIVKEAVSLYLEHISWYGAEVQKGRDDVATGQTVDPEHVKARITELGLHVD